MPTGKVLSVQIKTERGKMEFRPFVEGLANGGLRDDIYQGREDRQVLLLSKDTLDAHDLRPGDLREQVTVDLPDLQSLSPGTNLRIGATMARIIQDCAPCLHMAETVGTSDPSAWVKELMGRRGMFVTITTPGRISVGDDVEVIGTDSG
jgi:MOSC domain-containing protein YiiM